MGIYDREYYRREGPSYLGSFMERGKVCKWLVIINVVCFAMQMFSPALQLPEEIHGQQKQPFTEIMQLDAQDVSHGQVWRLLTYAFMHATVMHILFNMLFLWWLGTDVEDLYGPGEFLTFYLTAAVAGALAFVAAWFAGLGSAGPCVGASGAVMAVTVVCALHYPTRIIWFLIPMPIWLFVLIQVASNWFIFASQVDTTTAVTVHLGGAVFGYAYYKLHWRLSSFFSGWKTGIRRSRPRARLRVYREEEGTRPMVLTAPPAADVDEQLEAKLDAILEKVARSGQDSLTENERQLLLRASEVYKRRKT
jgi:membrane associated rhomboid family serine protease